MADKISFEEFANATFTAIMRAIEAHKQMDSALIKNPHITVGIIWQPQLEQQVIGRSSSK